MRAKIDEKRPSDDFEIEPGEPLRWVVRIIYRTDTGTTADVQTIDEIENLHAIIENGPNFYAVKHISIAHNPEYLKRYPGLAHMTLEQAARE